MRNRKPDIERGLAKLAEWVEPKVVFFHRTLRSLAFIFLYAMFFYLFFQFMEFQTEIACEAKAAKKSVAPTYKGLPLVE